MRVLITGANGMVGQALERSLTAEGHQVNCLVRRPRLQRVAPHPKARIMPGTLTGEPSTQTPWRDWME